jgi:hypothetical protein
MRLVLGILGVGRLRSWSLRKDSSGLGLQIKDEPPGFTHTEKEYLRAKVFPLQRLRLGIHGDHPLAKEEKSRSLCLVTVLISELRVGTKVRG